ncbi:MAG: nicotinamidase, partial [Caldimonas sp.]
MMFMQRRDFVRHGGFAGLIGLGLVPGAFAAATLKPDAKSALLVIDVQNCFVTGGTLPVKEGEQVVPVINKLSAAFENVVVTQDWHTPG